MAETLLPVILAGGAGTRLWPLSREQHPKQFLRVPGDKTMLQETLSRLDLLRHAAPVIVCHHEHRFLLAEQCREAGVEPGAIVLEPAGRNTAPAIALAAVRAANAGEDPLLLVLAADARIGAPAGFAQAVERAMPFAADGHLMTFGVPATRAETDYGYIRRGPPMAADAAVAEVVAFVEKPATAVAERYLAAGEYCWNSGMFLFRASAYLEELRRFAPDIHACCDAAVAAARRDLDFIRPGSAFEDSPALSIDHAVMERTQRALVVEAAMDWADLGSWDALGALLPRDADGNTVRGDAIAVQTRNSLLLGSGRLIAAVGLDGAVVVETADAVLVADKSRAQEVRQVVARLAEEGRQEHRRHATVYRPWGHAETIDEGPGFLIKRIVLQPGQSLSLQSHQHRAEHWVVVRGTAQVQRGDERLVLRKDESTYVPVGARHRLANDGDAPVELIEVQVGDYLSEDDIVRYEDRYGRAGM